MDILGRPWALCLGLDLLTQVWLWQVVWSTCHVMRLKRTRGGEYGHGVPEPHHRASFDGTSLSQEENWNTWKVWLEAVGKGRGRPCEVGLEFVQGGKTSAHSASSSPSLRQPPNNPSPTPTTLFPALPQLNPFAWMISPVLRRAPYPKDRRLRGWPGKLTTWTPSKPS